MGAPLLTTKLYIPRHQANLVPRLHLIEQLNAGLQTSRCLTLISAPAGFGKTTLLSIWAAQLDRPVAWLSLDESDNDPARFLRYVGTALVEASPDLTLSALSANPTPGIETAMVPLLNQIAGLSKSLVLILDDYHILANDTIDQALIFLVEHAPPNLHLVIATRSDPPFPLPRWRARQRLLELRAGNLRFTLEETAEFLRESLHLTLDDQDIKALDACAEGWIAALQLASASLRHHQDASGFIQALSGSHRYILDYLIAEVLQQQTAVVRRFLLQTAILDRLTAPLCEAVMDSQTAPAQQILVHLETRNLFLLPLDNERQWYRYHHLFRDFLRARLVAEQPEQVTVYHHRAAQWYAKAGMEDDAIRHALKAEDENLAAALIAQRYPSMMQQGEIATLKRWIEALPPSRRDIDPALLLAYAWTRVVTLDAEDIKATLDQIERLVEDALDLPPEENASLRGEVLTLRASRAFQMGKMDTTIAHAESALAVLPEDFGVLRSAAAQNLGHAYSFLGRTHAASAAYEQAIQAGRRSGNHFVALSATVNLGELWRLHGRWRDAEALYRETLVWSKRHHSQPLDGLIRVGLGLIHWDRWEVTLAQQHLENGIELSRQTGSHTLETMATNALACLAAYQGRHDAVERWLEQHLALARQIQYEEAAGFADLLEAQCWIAQDHRDALRRWLARRSPLDHLSVDLHTFSLQVIGQAKLHLGDTASALEILSDALEQAEVAGWVQRQVEILLLETRAAMALDRPAQARASYQQALNLSWEEGFARPFVEAGECLIPILRESIATRPDAGLRDFILNILEALDAAEILPPPQAVAPALIEPLTDREMDVLRLLSTNLTTSEIAENLVISYHTARTHVKHIYSKLDTHSRYEAVTRARELNLL